MDGKTLPVDLWAEKHKNEIIRDLFRLVRVPSVSDPASGVKPFGRECINALETMYALAASRGYEAQDFAHTVGRIRFTPKWENHPEAGIWCHLDVVPVPNPEDWIYPPFSGTIVEDRYLIGRGIQDNKMPAIAVLYCMTYLLQNGWEPQKNWCLYLGTSEENGMEDVRWFIKHHRCPELSLVPDTGFPVCIGQRGCQILRYSIPAPLDEGETLAFRCGSNVSVTPEKVTAVFSGGETIRTQGHGFHIERADEDNAVLQMLSALEERLPEAGKALERLSSLLSSPEKMGMAFADADSGALSAKPTQMAWASGRLSVDVYCVLPVTADPEALLKAAVQRAGEAGAACERVLMRPPRLFRKDHPLVDLLTGVYREVTGNTEGPFIMTGGNYASLLPNALGFGPGMPGRVFPESIFPQGHGDYHQCDESEDWVHIVRFMQIYVRAIERLDRMDTWDGGNG